MGYQTWRDQSATPYRRWRLDDLVREREAMGWQLADNMIDFEEWSFPLESREFMQYQIAHVDAELAHRKTLERLPQARRWPVTNKATQREEWAAVKAKADLRSFIETYSTTRLVKRGKEWVGICPFPDHQEKHGSFYVNEDKQVFHCHGCHRGGDVFWFARYLLNIESLGKAFELVKIFAGMGTQGVFATAGDGSLVRIK